MYVNALRCIESDYPELLALAELLGAITITDGVVKAADYVTWDYIGYKLLENGEALADAHGNKYVHINTLTPFSVGERAAELAAGNPELGAALVNVGKFFIVDGNGQVVLPEYPMRVFA